MAEACANCGEFLAGAYCAACGQRRMQDGDRRLGHLLGQFFSAATDLDGRFWRSLRALVFQPGRLSRDYLDGRRRYWMAPMSLFLLANVVYFLAPTALNDFNPPLSDQMGQVHAPVSRPMLERRVAERDRLARQSAVDPPVAGQPAPGYTFEDMARAYDAQSGNVGKALIIVHVPFIALGLAVVFWRRRMYFAEHLVVACHQFTFLLLYLTGFLLPLEWGFRIAGASASAWLGGLLLASLAAVIGHFAVALRRTYAAPWWLCLLLPVPLIVLMFVGNVWIYRTLQFFITFAIT